MMTSKRISLFLSVLCSLASLSNAFNLPSSRVATRSTLFLRTSPLASTTSPNENVLKDIDKKIANASKQKNDALAKLNEVESKLENLEKMRTVYLGKPDTSSSTPPESASFSETIQRSAIKAFAWRILAGSVTFITSLRFSGSLKTALKIVGSDFFSKAFTMFVGERLMNKSQAGRKSGKENASRSLVKALIWRLFAIANTLTMSLVISKDLSMASKIAGSDAIFKTGLMFFYERVWARIEWGKEYLIEFSI